MYAEALAKVEAVEGARAAYRPNAPTTQPPVPGKQAHSPLAPIPASTFNGCGRPIRESRTRPKWRW